MSFDGLAALGRGAWGRPVFHVTAARFENDAPSHDPQRFTCPRQS